MSAVFSVGEVPAADRLDVIEGFASATWAPMECRSEFRADYQGEFRISDLGAMRVVRLDIMPITVRRTPELITQADPDMLKLVLVCGRGCSVVEQDGRQARLSASDFAIYDTRRPYEVVCGAGQDQPTRLLTFMFSPALLPLPRSLVRRLAAVRIPAADGVGELTSQFLQLARNIDQYSPAEAARLSTAAMEILATGLAHEFEVEEWSTPEARRHALLTAVQAFIRMHLGDPALSLAAIAAAHHISVRSLHQIFHAEGLTVAGWIRQRRLEACRRDLDDPQLAARPVAAIAARWGFSSAGDFSRAFRAAHGLPPGKYRRLARNVNNPAL